MIKKNENIKINFNKLIFFYLENFFKKKIHEILQVYISFFSIFFYFIFYFLSKENAVNFIVIVSLINIITISLSANARNISIIFSDKNYCLKVVNFRLFMAIVIALICLFVEKFLAYYIEIEANFIFSIIFLVTSFWVLEPIVAFHELNKLRFKSIIFFLIHVLIFIFFIFFLFFNTYGNLFISFLLVISSVNFLYIFLFFFEKKKINTSKLNFKINNLAYLSSISSVISVFLIRIILTQKLNLNLGADIILGFSIANFPGSLITSFYGAKYLNKDIILPYIFKYIFFIYLLTALVLVIFKLTNLYLSYNELILIIIFAILGSFFGFFSQIFRIMHMSSLSLKYVFLKDIVFHISLIILIYLFLYFNFYFYLLLLICPIFSFYIYCSTKFYDLKKI